MSDILDFQLATVADELELADTPEIARKRGEFWLNTQVRPFRQKFLAELERQAQAAVAVSR